MKMLRSFLILFACFIPAIHASGELPEPGDVGVGAMYGTMGAINAKVFFTDKDAGLIGVEFADHPWSVIYADYQHHFRNVFRSKNRFLANTTPYIGFGTGVGFWDRLKTCGRWNCQWTAKTSGSGNAMFIRAVAGIEWFPKGWPMGAFAEFAPSIMWYPSSGKALDAAVGARYYF